MIGLLRVLFGLIVVMALLVTLGVLQNAPPLSEPPGAVVRLYTYLTSNVAETTKGSPFPELRPRVYPLPAAELYAQVRAAIARLPGWQIVATAETRHEVQAVVTTRIFRFKDDVTVRIVPGDEGGSIVTVRSASRLGRGDLAANVRHILDLYEMLERAGVRGEVQRVTCGGRRCSDGHPRA